MKHAYVTADHHGDDGTVAEGMILSDVSNERFQKLEKAGLVREATDEEIKAGYQPTIDADESKVDDAEDDGNGGEKQAPKPDNKQAPKPATKAA